MAGMTDRLAGLGPQERLDAGRVLDAMVSLPAHFRLLGYHVPDTFVTDFMRMLSAIPEDEVGGYAGNALSCEPLVRPLVVRTPGEDVTFHRDYEDYVSNAGQIVVDGRRAERLRQSMAEEGMARQDAEAAQASAEYHRKRLEGLRKRQAASASKPPVSKQLAKRLDEAMSAAGDAFDDVFGGKGGAARLRRLPDIATGNMPVPPNDVLDGMTGTLRDGMKDVMRHEKRAQLMALVSVQQKAIEQLRKHRRDMDADTVDSERDLLNRAQTDYENAMRRSEELQARMREIAGEARRSMLEKTGSESHRERFADMANRAVQSPATGVAALDTDFNRLTAGERAAIGEYIRQNARQFKTRMTRNLRTSSKHAVAMAETCRRACATGGVPIDLRFVRPQRNKARLLMFLDVSGSCKEASDLMLTFMSQMFDVFPAGCIAYAFVNSLYDVSAYLRDAADTDEAVDGVLSAIPTRGVYSNYHEPLRDFAENHMSEVTSDTIVFYIGDARNNKYDDGAKYLKRVARRARRTYWIETEPHEEWDRGDSVISHYAPYVDRVGEALTPGQLIGFLMEIR